MNFSKALSDGAAVIWIPLLIGYIVLFVSKHEKGEYDWKEFGKFVIFGTFLSVAAFLGSLFGIGGWGGQS